MEKTERLLAELQHQGQKITKQRKAILRVLGEADSLLTAEEIQMRVREGNENASLATVYRNLKILLEAGVVVLRGSQDEKAQYKLNDGTHSHNLVCLRCHKVVPLENCPLEKYADKIGREEGFTITEHRMELYGYCFDCCHKKK